MIFNLGIIALSILIFYFLERRFLLADWFLPAQTRLRNFVTGFCFSLILCVIFHLLVLLVYAGNAKWNEEFSFQLLGKSLLYDFNSVLYEELIFRGILLFILLKYLGKKAIWISAIAFGIYHWFTQGVLGNPVAMIFVFILTGSMGYVLAVAFQKTRSIVLPFALHFGWNATNHNIFSNGPNGDILMNSFNEFRTQEYWLLFFFLYLMVPVAIYLLLKKLEIKTAD